MKARISFGLMLVLLLLAAAPIYAQADNYFDQGKELYKAERYRDAIKRWEAVITLNKHSAALYFNLGNAHYQLNELGPSVYYYEKALILAPNDRDILSNRSFVQNALVDIIQPMPKTLWAKWNEGITNFMTTSQWAVASVLGMIGFVLLFLVYSWAIAPGFKRVFFSLSMLGLFLSLSFGLLAYKSEQFMAQNHWAIVFDQELILRSGPRVSDPVLFELHEGAKVKIMSTDDSWRLVMSEDGREGWILAESIREL